MFGSQCIKRLFLHVLSYLIRCPLTPEGMACAFGVCVRSTLILRRHPVEKVSFLLQGTSSILLEGCLLLGGLDCLVVIQNALSCG